MRRKYQQDKKIAAALKIIYFSFSVDICVLVGFLNSEVVVNKLAVKQLQVCFFFFPLSLLNYFRYQAEKSVGLSVIAHYFILCFFKSKDRNNPNNSIYI